MEMGQQLLSPSSPPRHPRAFPMTSGLCLPPHRGRAPSWAYKPPDVQPSHPPRRLTPTKWDSGRAWEWIPNPGFPGASSCLLVAWPAAGCGCCLTWWFVLGCWSSMSWVWSVAPVSLQREGSHTPSIHSSSTGVRPPEPEPGALEREGERAEVREKATRGKEEKKKISKF